MIGAADWEISWEIGVLTNSKNRPRIDFTALGSVITSIDSTRTDISGSGVGGRSLMRGGRFAATLIASLISCLYCEAVRVAWNHISMWECALVHDCRVSGLVI